MIFSRVKFKICFLIVPWGRWRQSPPVVPALPLELLEHKGQVYGLLFYDFD